MGLVIFVMALNFVFSILNAVSVGRAWTDSKAVGGFFRFVVWCGAIMSFCGFTWTYVLVEALVGQSLGYLTPEDVTGLVSIGYIVLIFPILGSGLGITAHSWLAFARRRSLGNAAIAGYNTFAQVHNMYRAMEGVPRAWDNVGKLFNSKNSKGLVLVVLFLIAAILGFLSTYLIVRAVANSHRRAIQRQFAEVEASLQKS